MIPRSPARRRPSTNGWTITTWGRLARQALIPATSSADDW